MASHGSHQPNAPGQGAARTHSRPGWHRAATEALARFDRRRLRPLGVTPDFYDLPHERLALVTDDGVTLDGWYVPAPAAAERASLGVVMHHHYGGQKAALLPWIELFHRLGAACLAFDARGHAASPCAQAEESYRQRFADVRAAHAELVRLGHRRIVGYGQSQGGAVLIGGLSHASELEALILDSGPAALAMPAMWGMARSLLPDRVPHARLATGAITLELVRRMRPADYALRLWPGLLRMRDRPLLWLHGSADRVIPRPWVEPWFRLLEPRAPRWEAMMVPGADHVQCLQQDEAGVARRVQGLLERLPRG
jgi:alpha-beta hydrolase superfamily lysophospholipase